MSFRKRKVSADVDKAQKRLDGISSIDPNLDLGNGLTVAAYSAEIDRVADLTAEYNTMLSQIDGVLTTLQQAERNLANFSERILSAIGVQFGYDSVEYEKAGGTRKSERKRPAKKNGGTKNPA